MKTKNLVGMMMLSLGLSGIAHAEKVGNGGLAVVCRNASGGITFARLLDLLESEIRDQKPTRTPETSLDKELSLTSDRIAQASHHTELKQIFLDAVKNLKTADLVSGFDLPDPQDFHPRVAKAGCTYEAVGLYDDTTGILSINRKLANALSVQDYSAFLTHEVIFHQRRATGDEFSDNSRLMVGSLYQKDFSTRQTDAQGHSYDVIPPGGAFAQDSTTTWISPTLNSNCHLAWTESSGEKYFNLPKQEETVFTVNGQRGVGVTVPSGYGMDIDVKIAGMQTHFNIVPRVIPTTSDEVVYSSGYVTTGALPAISVYCQYDWVK